MPSAYRANLIDTFRGPSNAWGYELVTNDAKHNYMVNIIHMVNIIKKSLSTYEEKTNALFKWLTIIRIPRFLMGLSLTYV